MMRIRGFPLLWAGREILAQPGAALLVVLALGLMTAMLAAALLLSQALTSTTARLLDAGPDLVVRRVGPEGWLPVPDVAAAAALAVPGVIEARPRIWGTARMADNATVAVMAADEAALGRMADTLAIRPPARGEAVAGPGIRLPDDGWLPLAGAGRLEVRVVRRFPAESGLAAHDLVMLHPADARDLLGLPAGAASDLALSVFHTAEADALGPELSQAFPWPVHLVTREETRKHYAAAFGRRGGLAAALYLPSAVAMVLLMAAVVRQQIGGRGRVGLLKALGWTGRDIVALQMAKALLVGLPAIAAGMILAYALVYGPFQQWAGHLLLGWRQNAPLLQLDAGHAAPVFLEIGGLLLAPYLTAVLWSSLSLAATDAQALLRRGV